MSSIQSTDPKKVYKHYRAKSFEQLWGNDVPTFDEGTATERAALIGLIRAVGVVAAETGHPEKEKRVRPWLIGLLKDGDEKVRRYAMNALAKVGAGPSEEKILLELRRETTSDREKQGIDDVLWKMGGAATLEAVVQGAENLSAQTIQRANASVARSTRPSSVRFERISALFEGLRLKLRCRDGLEGIIDDELGETQALKSSLSIESVSPGLVVARVRGSLSIEAVYELRSFVSLNIHLATIKGPLGLDKVDRISEVITDPKVKRLLEGLTDGPIRYRLDCVGSGAHRGLVRKIASTVYGKAPELLNDTHSAPWAIDLHAEGNEISIELRPKLSPDPRFAYRIGDVPASTHPQFAAAMAFLAGDQKEEVLWDPFCGSGSELIECSFNGGMSRTIGTDLDAKAIAIAQVNLDGTKGGFGTLDLVTSDYQAYADEELSDGSVSLIITNPPMGKRVQADDLNELMKLFFETATKVLKSGGQLVLLNQTRTQARDKRMTRNYHQKVDMGGFTVWMERYRKA